MRIEPPSDLVALLERLNLATAVQVRQVHPRVRRLSRGLAPYLSVWVDALVQARLLTLFQADQIRSGRAEELAVGNLVLVRPRRELGYASWFEARHRSTGAAVDLYRWPAGTAAPKDRHPLAAPVGAPGGADARAWPTDRPEARMPACLEVGSDDRWSWAVYPHTPGMLADDWIVRYGRFPPIAVLEIARQMAAVLDEQQDRGVLHGDLAASALVLLREGQVGLTRAGLRPWLRPGEGFALDELPPEAYDYLAPERAAQGLGPTVASELFACGALWWHLLCGRAPLRGGSAVSKLRAAEMGRIADVRQLAHEAPAELAAAIKACLMHEPRQRPTSFAQLRSMLGPPTRSGATGMRREIARSGPAGVQAAALLSEVRGWPRPVWAAAAGLAVSLALVTWPLWNPASSGRASRTDPVGAPRDSALQPHPIAPSKSASQIDPQVQPAALVWDSQPATQADAVPSALGKAAVLLAADRVHRLDTLDLQPGQVIRGEHGQRVQILVPPEGLRVLVEGLRFEGIDFVWEERPQDMVQMAEPAAIVAVWASRIEFDQCTFSAPQADRLPVAINWCGPRAAGLLAPSGRLKFSGCAFRDVAAAVQLSHAAPLGMELQHSLHLGPGPLVRLGRCPNVDEPIELSLAHVTLREAAALVECGYEQLADQPGGVHVAARACVLAPRVALWYFRGNAPPTALLRAATWSGQGSLLAEQRPYALWASGAGRQTLDQADLAAEGIVVSRCEFADRAEAGVAASRLVRWQAPLRSPQPPGIGEPLPASFPALLPGAP